MSYFHFGLIHMQVWTNCAPDADQSHKTSETHPTFWSRTCFLVKKKKTLDLHVFSRVGKTVKKLH